MVTDVSAMFVETIALRTPCGAMSKTLSCCSMGSWECSGNAIQRFVLAACSEMAPTKASISKAPGTKIRTSPLSSASVEASMRLRSCKYGSVSNSVRRFGLRMMSWRNVWGSSGWAMFSTSTGKALPGTSTTASGGSWKKSTKSSFCNVADMSTSLNSGRRFTTSRKMPSSKSTDKCRSCTSSTKMTSKSERSRSDSSNLTNIPSVKKSIRVCTERVESNRIWCAITEPFPCSRSCETRRARETAARRRGCVTAMPRKPAARRYCGTCVDLPQPVSPATSTTW
mmetsp:Transcript_47892/g.154479  ORF Transcript_47892/g.154479 Transcript_47892/m.154479 type:complete len:283 (-) Transcript_47892:910-1758(-)